MSVPSDRVGSFVSSDLEMEIRGMETNTLYPLSTSS